MRQGKHGDYDLRQNWKPLSRAGIGQRGVERSQACRKVVSGRAPAAKREIVGEETAESIQEGS